MDAAPRRLTAVTAFCGSAAGRDPEHVAAAKAFGRRCAARGVDVVFGGGSVGMMGAVADAAVAAGGRVIGVIPRRLEHVEMAHRGVTRLHVVDGLAERKSLLAHLSDAYVALPGGLGTLDEICEMLTWARLGYQDKPVGLLAPDGFWDPLVALFEHFHAAGFMPEAPSTVLHRADTADAMLDRLQAAL